MLVWYVAYGSNMHAARLAWYIGGGCPPGGRRTYPGCRDRRPPSRSVPVSLPGGIYFAGESRAWTGGMAFYDPDLPDEAAARAYLVTVEQFTDIAAQEMYRPVDLAEATGAAIEVAVAEGRATLGPGRYETLVCPGGHDGVPLLTFTAPEGMSAARCRPPAPIYLGMIARGLYESHGWPAGRITTYLAARPGVPDGWTPEAVATLVTEALAGA
ncbi:histone deacetylase [Micromonospora sp. WMMD1120]|uniref:histone deacetylase n=1 Tax=Micromonospora sp. WMMD1120 TaxID=3016106 RepID=UPI002416A511|nr:histone deacetylase [Micromonospora sp. WMMD1120]MDG4806693.1 histone deacetylase [Micromonospora sp. WMMD1120]